MANRLSKLIGLRKDEGHLTLGDPHVLKLLCLHRTEADTKRIQLWARGPDGVLQRFRLTPVMVEEFCLRMIRERRVYERCVAEKRPHPADFPDGIWVWDPDLTEMIDQQIRKRLPQRNQRVTLT